MTDFYFDDSEALMATDEAPAKGRWRVLNGVGTALGLIVSIGLMASMAVWGYRLMVRDVEGVPVIRAMEGSFRTTPDDPGGRQAPNQGLAVNTVAAGAEETPLEEVRLAPVPMGVGPDDAAGLDLSAPLPSVDVALDRSDAVTAVLDDSDLGAGIVEEGLVDGGVAPGDAVEDRPEDALGTDLAVADALRFIAEDDGAATATATSYVGRPTPRPANFARTTGGTGQSAVAAPIATETVEIAPAALSQGTRLAQLGAFADAETARQQWDLIAARFPEVFSGKRRVVQGAVPGGTLWRLRVEGFADLDDSRRFCAVLLSARTDCIPVAVQ